MSSEILKSKKAAWFLKAICAIIFFVFIISLYSCNLNKSVLKQKQDDMVELETPQPNIPQPNRMFNLDFLIVGTLNDIRLEQLEWTSLTVKYWLFNPDKSYSPGRVITISDREAIQKLNYSFATKSVSAMSVANHPRFVLTLTNGQQWSIDMPHPNRIYCCQTDNNKNACVIILSNTQFYERLREICFEHEKTITPDAIIDNVVLCDGGIRNDIIENKVPYSPTASLSPANDPQEQ